MMTAFVLGMALGQLALFSPAKKALGLLPLALLAEGGNALSVLLFSFVAGPSDLPLWFAGLSGQLVASSLGAAVPNVMVAELAPSSRMGTMMGLTSTCESVRLPNSLSTRCV